MLPQVQVGRIGALQDPPPSPGPLNVHPPAPAFGPFPHFLKSKLGG